MSMSANGLASSSLSGGLEGAGASAFERLRGRRQEIEESIFRHVCEEVPDPEIQSDAEYLVGLRTAVVVSVEYGLASIECGGNPLPPVPPDTVAQARRAARGGVSLENVLLRYTVGAAMLEDFILQESESGGLLGQPGALRELLGVHARALRRLTLTIAEEYRDEHEREACSPGERRAELVRGLLAGEPIDLARFDYDFGSWHIGMIASGAQAASVLRSIQAALHGRLLTINRGEAVWTWHGSGCRVDAASVERLLAAGLPKEVALAIGEPAQGIAGWRATHRQAQEALLAALRTPGQPILFADVALLAPLLADPARARSFVEMHLSPLDGRREGGPALRRTLRAYLRANHNMNATAAALGVDRSTVRRHIRLIEEAIGVPLERRQAELTIALRLEELDRVDASTPSSIEG
jgi:DNA-binding transcriptional ArsR family regulator